MMITGIKHEETNSITVIVDMKKKFFITKHSDGWVNIVMLNASHSVWRSAGKVFSSFDKAKDNYKSSAAKSALDYAKEFLN